MNVTPYLFLGPLLIHALCILQPLDRNSSANFVYPKVQLADVPFDQARMWNNHDATAVSTAPTKETAFQNSLMIGGGVDQPEGWSSLWNGTDLSGWQTYLNTAYQRREDENGNVLRPYGIDNDPLEVMSVVDMDDGGSAIRISGVAWGTLHTLANFSNYHLTLKVMWGQAVHPPRENRPRDSGLLYHCFGEPGAYNPWMSSQELQIQEGDTGDYWPTGDVEIDVPVDPHERGYYIYQNGAPLRTFYFADYNPDLPEGNMTKRRVYKGNNAERPNGEWNDIELIAYGDTSIHVVNGEVVMRLFNSRVASTQAPLTQGRIALQSEGAEVYYKEILIRSISEIPAVYR